MLTLRERERDERAEIAPTAPTGRILNWASSQAGVRGWCTCT